MQLELWLDINQTKAKAFIVKYKPNLVEWSILHAEHVDMLEGITKDDSLSWSKLQLWLDINQTKAKAFYVKYKPN